MTLKELAEMCNESNYQYGYIIGKYGQMKITSMLTDEEDDVLKLSLDNMEKLNIRNKELLGNLIDKLTNANSNG